VTTRNGPGTRGPRRGQPRRPRQPPVRRGAGEEVPRQRREVPPAGARGRARGQTLALPDAQRVEDLTALRLAAVRGRALTAARAGRGRGRD
jgi:hypothetical protein